MLTYKAKARELAKENEQLLEEKKQLKEEVQKLSRNLNNLKSKYRESQRWQNRQKLGWKDPLGSIDPKRRPNHQEGGRA